MSSLFVKRVLISYEHNVEDHELDMAGIVIDITKDCTLSKMEFSLKFAQQLLAKLDINT